MKLEKVLLENYRGFKEPVTVDFESITAFIGRNDVGKSSFLEALNTFFNDKEFKFEALDRCVHCRDSEATLICCVFSDLPEQIILDETVSTSFESEYLLNGDGYLEIHKQFDAKGKQSIFLRANHPSNNGFSDLLSKKNSELKKLIKDCGLEGSVNLTVNNEMRKALWNHVGEGLVLTEQLVPLDKEEAKNIWDKIQKLLPRYALFKADRPSTDADKEAQDPIKLAVKKALNNQIAELEKISATVANYVETVAAKTIEKLSEFDSEIASQLSPNFTKDPDWAKAFAAFSMLGNDSIPINKRGSGVRRLVLFSFFRADIESEDDFEENNGIIYAVEEPETSQHPDFQKIVVETFLKMTENPLCQVILTTHVPGLAGLLPRKSLRHVVMADSIRSVLSSSREDENSFLDGIANTLGVHPNITNEVINPEKVKVILCVEGPHDVAFFETLSDKLHSENNDIMSIRVTENVSIISLGGESLQHWVNCNYLAKLNIIEYHIYDKDGDGKYQEFCDTVNQRGTQSSARLTSKRTIENYLHPKAVEEVFGLSVKIENSTDVPLAVSNIMKEKGMKFSNKGNVKAKLNREAVSGMSLELLRESDPDGDILGWLAEVKRLANNLET